MSVLLAALRPRIAGSTWDKILGARWIPRSGSGPGHKESDGRNAPVHPDLHTVLLVGEQKVADWLLDRGAAAR
jgi:hypothetical protein